MTAILCLHMVIYYKSAAGFAQIFVVSRTIPDLPDVTGLADLFVMVASGYVRLRARSQQQQPLGRTASHPVYSESMMYINHSRSGVRAGARWRRSPSR